MNSAKEIIGFYKVKTAPFTHVNLLSGRKGRVIEQRDGEVVIQCELGSAQSYDQDRLHLTWAPLPNYSN